MTTQLTALTPRSATAERDIWLAGVAVGLRTLAREPILGLKRLLLPVSYWRYAEFAYVWRHLAVRRGSKILDLGSPKELAFMMATRQGCAVTATDILPEAVALSRRYALAQRIEGRGPGLVHSEVQDGRALGYPDGTFDAAYSVSVLEHIPDDGDSRAIRELLRVVKPGGTVVVTVPFDRSYRETFVDGPVYERRPTGSEPVFFERHHDESTLAQRLVAPSGGELVDLEIWGEQQVRMESLLARLGRLRTVLSPVEPILSRAFLRPVSTTGAGHPMAAFLTIQKASHR